MTPAERLLAAADLLDKRASEAIAEWELDDDNHLGLVSIVTPLSGPTANAGGRYSFTGPDDATTHYIATMHPEVGKALAAWLRHEGQGAAAGLGVLTPTLRLADLVLAGGGEQS